MSASYGDCRHITDIGTRYVASSLAIGSNLKTPVWTFDIPLSTERQSAFRGKSEEVWQKQVQDVGVNVKFHNLDLLKVSKEDLRTYLGTFFVMLDTFQNLTLNHLNANSFRGCLILWSIRGRGRDRKCRDEDRSQCIQLRKIYSKYNNRCGCVSFCFLQPYKENHITIISKCAPIYYVEFTNAHKMRASIDQTCCHAYVNNIWRDTTNSSYRSPLA